MLSCKLILVNNVVRDKAYNLLIIRNAIAFIYFEVQTLCIKTYRHAGLIILIFISLQNIFPLMSPKAKVKVSNSNIEYLLQYLDIL